VSQLAEPPPDDRRDLIFAPGAGRVLSPRLRTALYLVAGILVTLWLVIELYGAGGFFALLLGAGASRLAYGWRRSLNVAFVAGAVVFLVALVLWGSLLAERWDEATATPTPSAVTGR
jgi:hypothetical protein